MALPAVPPVTVREPHTGSHRVGGRWNCKPEISDAEQAGGLRRTRVFDSLDSGFLRVYAEEDVNPLRISSRCLEPKSGGNISTISSPVAPIP